MDTRFDCTMDTRFDCLVAFTKGKTIRVGEYRFQPLRNGKVVIFENGKFTPEVTDWFGGAVRCGNLLRQTQAWN